LKIEVKKKIDVIFDCRVCAPMRKADLLVHKAQEFSPIDFTGA